MSDTPPVPPRRAAASSQIPPPSSRTTSAPPPSPPRRTVPSNGNVSPQKQAVLDIIDVAKIPLATVATIQQLREPNEVSPYLMDMYAIDNFKDPIANAIVKIADSNPVVLVILEKVGMVTPAAELISVAIGLFMQCAENHRKLPAGIAEHMPGVMPREELIGIIAEDAERMKVNVG